MCIVLSVSALFKVELVLWNEDTQIIKKCLMLMDICVNRWLNSCFFVSACTEVKLKLHSSPELMCVCSGMKMTQPQEAMLLHNRDCSFTGTTHLVQLPSDRLFTLSSRKSLSNPRVMFNFGKPVKKKKAIYGVSRAALQLCIHSVMFTLR